MPGFVDAHFHFLGYSFDRQRARLDRATSVAEVQRLVAAAAAKVGPDGWVLGRGWDRNLWPGAAFPTRHDLDAVAGGRPVCLLSRDVHAVWANTPRAGAGRDHGRDPGPARRQDPARAGRHAERRAAGVGRRAGARAGRSPVA